MSAIIDGPGYYLDRLGRGAWVKERAPHNDQRWMGVAGDGDPACWEASGVMEASLPSAIDIVDRVALSGPTMRRCRGSTPSNFSDNPALSAIGIAEGGRDDG